MLRYKHIITVLLLLGFTLQANALSKNINEWLNKLDRSLEKAPMYKAEHEQQINDLKKLVTAAKPWAHASKYITASIWLISIIMPTRPMYMPKKASRWPSR